MKKQEHPVSPSRRLMPSHAFEIRNFNFAIGFSVDFLCQTHKGGGGTRTDRRQTRQCRHSCAHTSDAYKMITFPQFFFWNRKVVNSKPDYFNSELIFSDFLQIKVSQSRSVADMARTNCTASAVQLTATLAHKSESTTSGKGGVLSQIAMRLMAACPCQYSLSMSAAQIRLPH